MQGLRAAPWFHEFSRRGQLGISDCETCMKSNGQAQRQTLGCGYEPRTDRMHLTVWQPPSGGSSGRGYRGPELTTCAGYTVNLPEVTEAVVARAHWKHGAVVAACDGAQPTEDLLNSILIFDQECSTLESWLLTPAKDGGGGA